VTKPQAAAAVEQAALGGQVSIAIGERRGSQLPALASVDWTDVVARMGPG